MLGKGRPQKEYTEDQKREVKNAYKKCRNVKEKNRILCIKLRVIKGMNTRQISSITELSEGYVKHIIGEYAKDGLRAVKAQQQTSHHRNMTPVQEEEFLKKFREQAIAGQILEVSSITEAYSKTLNKKVSKSTVYIFQEK